MASAQSPWWRWLVVAAIIAVLDQYTKTLILDAFQLHEGKVVTSYFNLVRAHNPGAAFSFLANAGGWQRWFFTGLALVATVVITWMLRKYSEQKMFATALTLILGGAVGNVIDRLIHGYVVDFLQFHWNGAAFPSFNVADSAITLGAVLLIVDELRRVKGSR
jgi:signal peptidase II